MVVWERHITAWTLFMDTIEPIVLGVQEKTKPIFDLSGWFRGKKAHRAKGNTRAGIHVRSGTFYRASLIPV